MNLELIAGIIAAIIVLGAVGFIIWVKVPKSLKQEEFVKKWKELQGYCKDKSTWPQALEAADKLLDKALKKRKFKGESMGERMVSAQKSFTENDNVWFAHNLYKKAFADDAFRLKESDVKQALIGFRQALRDLGALPDAKKNQAIKVEK